MNKLRGTWDENDGFSSSCSESSTSSLRPGVDTSSEAPCSDESLNELNYSTTMELHDDGIKLCMPMQVSVETSSEAPCSDESPNHLNYSTTMELHDDNIKLCRPMQVVEQFSQEDLRIQSQDSSKVRMKLKKVKNV